MSLSAIPSELLLHICSLSIENDNFTSLRLINSSFDALIRSNTTVLIRTLLRRYSVAGRAQKLYEISSQESISHTVNSWSGTLLNWLSLQNHINAGIYCAERLATRYRTSIRNAGFSNDLPNPLPGGLESLLLFSAFHKALHRSTDEKESHTKSTIFVPGAEGEPLRSNHVPDYFVNFLQNDLSLKELELIMNTVCLCVDEIKDSGYLPTLRSHTAARDDSHWQNPELRLGVLKELVLWKGPVWVKKTIQSLEQSPAKSDTTHTAQWQWQGTHVDAARLGASGLAKLLWKERQRKMAELEKEQAPADVLQMRGSQLRQRYAVIWKGGAGDM